MALKALLWWLLATSNLGLASPAQDRAPARPADRGVVSATVTTDPKVDYLVSLGAQNVSWVRTLTSILALMATIMAVSFISILVFIIQQLRAMSKERSLNEGAIRTIAEQGAKISGILQEIEGMKNEIRDAALATRKDVYSEADYLSSGLLTCA